MKSLFIRERYPVKGDILTANKNQYGNTLLLFISNQN